MDLGFQFYPSRYKLQNPGIITRASVAKPKP